MRKALLISGILALGLFLGLSAFVAFYDPTLPAAELPSDAGASWVEDGAERSGSSYRVVRGALDRDRATFPLTLTFAVDRAEDLEQVRLFVTSASGWGERGFQAWTQVAAAPVKERGAAPARLTLSADVPASSAAWRTDEIRAGAPCCAVASSMPEAPTLPGRVYDAIAWRGPFRWVPRLR
jgi:hypothetical protein